MKDDQTNFTFQKKLCVSVDSLDNEGVLINLFSQLMHCMTVTNGQYGHESPFFRLDFRQQTLDETFHTPFGYLILDFQWGYIDEKQKKRLIKAMEKANMKTFYEDFENLEDLKKQYELTEKDLEGVDILFAAYRTGCYDGQSLVLFTKKGKLYIVDASHCSCSGLEGKWDPVEVTEASLKMETEAKSNYMYDEFQSFIEFCNQHFEWEKKA